MFVGSLPEMHLTTYGWMLYNNVWALLSFIGIVVFPFIWIMFTAVVDAVKRHGPTAPEASAAAWFTVMPSIVLMLGVYALAVVPRVPLNINTWEYSQLCSTDAGVPQESNVVTPGNTNTPLDEARVLTQAGMKASDVRVPLLWDVIMRLGAGVSRAMNSAGACPTNATYLDKSLRQMKITDPNLQAELGQFAADCYIPARGKFMRAMENGTLDTVPTVNDATNPDQYVAAVYRDWKLDVPPNAANDELFSRRTDPGYIGSRFFLQTPGLYKPVTPGQNDVQGGTLKASKPVAGWSYEPIRDCSRTTRLDRDGNPWCTSPYNGSFAHNQGSPTCDEWWSDPDRGLQQKLRADAESSISIVKHMPGQPNSLVAPSEALSDVITSVDPGDAKSDAWLADKMVATAVANDVSTQEVATKKVVATYQQFDGIDSVDDVGTAFAALGTTLVSGFAVAAGAAKATVAVGAMAVSLASTAAEFYSTAWIVKQAYPIIQAYLMLFFIALMPVVMLGSLYDVARLYQLVLLFLGIMFLSPWRYVVEYLDERLFEIMFPNEWAASGTDVILHTKERLIIDVTTTLMYTLFPVILLWLVGMMGAEGARDIKSAFNSNNFQKFGASMGKWKGGGGGGGKK